MREAVGASVPSGTEELNLKAFDAGWSYFEQEYGAGGQGKEEAAVAAETTARA
jgi:Pyruvate/2-oxoacid:ferredoxin oxidoreductase gamma subunit